MNILKLYAPWRPKKEEFFHFIFILTNAVVHGEWVSKQPCRWRTPQLRVAELQTVAGLNNQRKKANIEFEKKDDDSLNGLFVCTCLPYWMLILIKRTRMSVAREQKKRAAFLIMRWWGLYNHTYYKMHSALWTFLVPKVAI